MLCKPYSFLVIDTTLASDNPLRFQENLLEIIWKLIIKIDDKIRDRKLQYNINREAPEVSALLSGKIDKCEYLTGKEILPSDPSRTIEQVKFPYFFLGKGYEKQVETLRILNLVDHQQKPKSIEGIFPKDLENNKINN